MTECRWKGARVVLAFFFLPVSRVFCGSFYIESAFIISLSWYIDSVLDIFTLLCKFNYSVLESFQREVKFDLEANFGVLFCRQPPENELQKGNGEKKMSEHELRVQRSLQKLNIPEWYKNSTVPAQGFLLKRHSDAGQNAHQTNQHQRWNASTLPSKTTSLSSLGSTLSTTPRSPTSEYSRRIIYWAFLCREEIWIGMNFRNFLRIRVDQIQVGAWGWSHSDQWKLESCRK